MEAKKKKVIRQLGEEQVHKSKNGLFGTHIISRWGEAQPKENQIN